MEERKTRIRLLDYRKFESTVTVARITLSIFARFGVPTLPKRAKASLENKGEKWSRKRVRVPLRLPSRHLWFRERLEREFHRGHPAQLLGPPFLLLAAADPATNASFLVRTVC